MLPEGLHREDLVAVQQVPLIVIGLVTGPGSVMLLLNCLFR